MWLLELAKVELLPWVNNAHWHDEVVGEEVAHAWYIATATDDDDLLDLTFIANPVVVIADHLANFGANALKAWFECLGDASLAWPRREAIEHLELVGILECDVEMLRDVDGEGIAANCHSTSQADGTFI